MKYFIGPWPKGDEACKMYCSNCSPPICFFQGDSAGGGGGKKGAKKKGGSFQTVSAVFRVCGFHFT